MPVAATYTARGGGSFARSEELHFLAGEGVSRVIEHLDLTKLGLSGTLHLTLAYAHGVVRHRGGPADPRRHHRQMSRPLRSLQSATQLGSVGL